MTHRTSRSRRRFLIGSLAGVSSAWLASRWPSLVVKQAQARQAARVTGPAALQFLSPEQAAEIDAVAAQIIPGGDTPGAREAGVVQFIDRALATFDRDEQATYTRGLAELESETARRFPPARRFSELTSEQQVALLKEIETTRFFKTVRVHVVEGFLSAPEYGGNRGGAGWKVIGFDSRAAFEPPFGAYDRADQTRG